MQTNPLTQLSVPQLKRAVTIRQRIERLEKELARVIGSHRAPARRAGSRRKGRLNAAARARISAAAKARWAKYRARKAGK